MPTRTQVFCFTYAGGSASFFDSIENDLPDFDVVKLEYSGHGSRHREPLYQSFQELSEDMYGEFLRGYRGGAYSLFGYSMGTISTVEVLKRIQAKSEMRLPDNVFLAAHGPQTKEELAGFAAGERDEMVMERTIRFGGVPPQLVQNKSFWRMYLPLYRADYSIIGGYRFEDLVLSSDVPVTVFYSETDTRFVDIQRWDSYFKGEIYYHEFEGGHFFINDHHSELAEVMQTRMSERNHNDV